MFQWWDKGNMASTPRIPEMFLKAAKRKSEVLKVSTRSNSGEPIEKSKKMEVEVTKKEIVTVVSKPKTAEPVPVTTDASSFSLYSLLQEEGWRGLLKAEFEKKYMRDVESFLVKQYEKKVQVFPPRAEIFSAFHLTPLSNVKVVILGQDPYHNDGQAHGLSFSVKKGITQPPSLKNMFKELTTDIPGFSAPSHGSLIGWAEQGVFMLNASLTVEAHKANSHAKIGWQTFTDQVIKHVSREVPNCVFLLWGGFAHKKEGLIDQKKHAVIKTAHPSPLSVRFFTGCRCFSKTNEKLEEFGMSPIDWARLP